MATELRISELPICFDQIVLELESQYEMEQGIDSSKDLLGTSTTLLKMYQTAMQYYKHNKMKKKAHEYEMKIKDFVKTPFMN